MKNGELRMKNERSKSTRIVVVVNSQFFILRSSFFISSRVIIFLRRTWRTMPAPAAAHPRDGAAGGCRGLHRGKSPSESARHEPAAPGERPFPSATDNDD